MTDPAIVAGLVELAKMGLGIFFQASREAGLDEQKAQELFEIERIRFNQNTPDKLKDV